MGAIPNMTHELYPQQSNNVGKRVDLCFHYNTKDKIRATIIRDDIGEPGEMIFLTDFGKVILSTECQYQLPAKDDIALGSIKFNLYKK